MVPPEVIGTGGSEDVAPSFISCIVTPSRRLLVSSLGVVLLDKNNHRKCDNLLHFPNFAQWLTIHRLTAINRLYWSFFIQFNEILIILANYIKERLTGFGSIHPRKFWKTFCILECFEKF